MRRVLFGMICLAITGCGFQPLLGERAAGAAIDDIRQVKINVIADRSGQILRNQLLNDLTPAGEPPAPLYRLEVRLNEPRQEIAVRRDESASRISYTANATFVMRDTAGRSLFSGSSSVSSTYEATLSEFASITGQRSARDRAMQEISADIRQQLAAYFMRARDGTGGGAPAPRR